LWSHRTQFIVIKPKEVEATFLGMYSCQSVITGICTPVFPQATRSYLISQKSHILLKNMYGVL
jgi:hypothetical protein